MSADPAPLIVSALLGAEDFAWADGLRRAHFPPERNILPAHLTLFHHLPPSVEPELRRRLRDATRGADPPRAVAAGFVSLGRGVAIRIDSPGLAVIRRDLAEAFVGTLTPQDAAGWRPHITVQNKVSPQTARASLQILSAAFRARPITITGLAAWFYRGGPWEQAARFMFG